MSAARPVPTSRSGAASTTAWARSSRACRAGSRSRCCWSASRGSTYSAGARSSATASCCADLSPCQCAAAAPDATAPLSPSPPPQPPAAPRRPPRLARPDRGPAAARYSGAGMPAQLAQRDNGTASTTILMPHHRELDWCNWSDDRAVCAPSERIREGDGFPGRRQYWFAHFACGAMMGKLRHTHTSRTLAQGEHLIIIGKLLSHTQV